MWGGEREGRVRKNACMPKFITKLVGLIKKFLLIDKLNKYINQKLRLIVIYVVPCSYSNYTNHVLRLTHVRRYIYISIL